MNSNCESTATQVKSMNEECPQSQKQSPQSENGSNGKYSEALNHAAKFGQYSLEMEEHRTESLLNQAGRMLTAFSVFVAAMLMAIPILRDSEVVDTNISLGQLFPVGILLIVSLFSATLAQWRFKYWGMVNAKEFRDYFYNDITSYTSAADYDNQWIMQLTNVHASLAKSNNLRSNLIKVSMACFLGAVVWSLLLACSLL